MQKMVAAVVMVALAAALAGCAVSNDSEVELKATVEKGKLSGQWEVQSDQGLKTGEFGGKPTTVNVGSFRNLESVYASAQRQGGSPMSSVKLTLELIVDGESVDEASTTDQDSQAIVQYSVE
jgi:hypothetical protein